MSINTRNTPKGIENDIATVASSFNLIKLDMSNSSGDIRDIRQLVESFVIVEELFSPVITFSATIRDTVNFFEDFGVAGQEILDLEIEKISDNSTINSSTPTKNIKLKLAVMEYPNYEKKASSPNIQRYSLIAISDFAYLSALKRISRSVKNAVIPNITKIFKDDLNVVIADPLITSTSAFDGIITIQSPLRAAEWLRSKLFDSVGSPFFLYNTIAANKPTLASWSYFTKKAAYRTYVYRQLLQTTPNTANAYAEAITRILEMQSNMKLNKLDLAKGGAFASTVNVTDFGNKTWTQQIFNADKSTSVLSTKLSSTSDITKQLGAAYAESLSFFNNGTTGKPTKLTDMANASIVNLNVNTVATPGTNLNSTSGPLLSNIANAKAFAAKMSSVTHEVTVFGDFSLNPGTKITIEIPKAVNVKRYDEENPNDKPNDDGSNIDRRISGDYIVTVATHAFADGQYTTSLTIVTDKL